jgi:Holliday junction DNA helicase RuvA
LAGTGNRPLGRIDKAVIGYIQGKILKKESDRLLVLANQIGFEILVPAVVMESLADRHAGDELALHVYYQQTERQPKPVLIGFAHEIEKEFFQNFISVEDIGPLKAVRAMTVPVGEIARAIEARDLDALARLKGIGKRTAQKIIATLEGRMGKFALMRTEPKSPAPAADDAAQQVLEVMVNQLGHRMADAKRMITEAFKRRPSVATPEELFEEVYRGEVPGSEPDA